MIDLKIYFVKLHYLLVISAIVIATYCAPLSKDSEAQITHYNYTNDGKGNYYFKYGTTNGLYREETGTLVNEGLPDEHISVEGIYTYIDSEGEYLIIKYVADENGYVVLKEPPITQVSEFPADVYSSLLGK